MQDEAQSTRQDRRKRAARLRRPVRDPFDGKKTVWEEISGGYDVITLAKREMNSLRLVSAAFNFKGPDQQKRVGQLSGGERNRVHLSKMLKSGANLLRSTSRPTTTTSTRFARGSAARLRRLRRHHQPRPVLPRPRRHPHAGLRRQFRRLREGQEAPPRDRQRHPAPAEVQEVQPLAWVT